MVSFAIFGLCSSLYLGPRELPCAHMSLKSTSNNLQRTRRVNISHKFNLAKYFLNTTFLQLQQRVKNSILLSILVYCLTLFSIYCYFKNMTNYQRSASKLLSHKYAWHVQLNHCFLVNTKQPNSVLLINDSTYRSDCWYQDWWWENSAVKIRRYFK